MIATVAGVVMMVGQPWSMECVAASMDRKLFGFLIASVVAPLLLALKIEQTKADRRALIALITTKVYTEHWNNQNKKRKARESTEEEEEDDHTNNKGNKRSRRATRHNHERAIACIQEDYLCERPIFIDKQFEEVFRLTKGCVEKIIKACVEQEPYFFAPGCDATGKKGIPVEVKVLSILKCCAFGCSGVAWRDYHQIARNTNTEALKAFFRAILADKDLSGVYLRTPNANDARRIEELHRKKHKVAGLLFSLDCCHIMWKNCPVGLQGHFKNGKNKLSSVVLEAAVDYHTWIWHASAGHPGTLNDINIWDVSDLQKAFLSEWWNNHIDFEFEVHGQKFNKLWVLVDGIYPAIARFVKTISCPIGAVMKKFAAWQEGARKDSERAFGILLRKFQILVTPNEYWELEDVKRQIYGCCLMHNMMVEVRIERNEEESENMYAVQEDAVTAETGNSDINKEAQADDEDHTHLKKRMGWQPDPDDIEEVTRLQMLRWDEMNNGVQHRKLQTAVMNQVAENYTSYQEAKLAARRRRGR